MGEGIVSKDAYYFSHDANARNDERIISLRMMHGWEGYGLYWAIIEMLRDANAYELETDYNRIAFALNSDKEIIDSIISCFELFKSNQDFFWSESLKRRMEIRDSKSQKARDSARARWDKRERNANALDTQCDGNAIKGKESKGKEKKVNKIKEEEKIEKARVEFEELSKPLFISLDGMSEYANFCDYWTTQNKLNDTLRFQEDSYFNMSVKVRGWLDKANKGKPPKTVTVQKAEGFE